MRHATGGEDFVGDPGVPAVPEFFVEPRDDGSVLFR
jgi:hypothetical protein